MFISKKALQQQEIEADKAQKQQASDYLKIKMEKTEETIENMHYIQNTLKLNTKENQNLIQELNEEIKKIKCKNKKLKDEMVELDIKNNKQSSDLIKQFVGNEEQNQKYIELMFLKQDNSDTSKISKEKQIEALNTLICCANYELIDKNNVKIKNLSEKNNFFERQIKEKKNVLKKKRII